MQRRIPAVYMRGGTSKGVFFHTRHLPHDADLRDRVILAVPKIVFCSSPQTYADLSGRLIEPGDMDLTARVISMGALHKAFAVTAAICTAGAAQIEGTVVHELARIDHHPDVRVGHPGGVLPVGARVTKCGDRAHFEEAVLERTARRLMEGSVLVPAATFFQGEEYA